MGNRSVGNNERPGDGHTLSGNVTESTDRHSPLERSLNERFNEYVRELGQDETLLLWHQRGFGSVGTFDTLTEHMAAELNRTDLRHMTCTDLQPALISGNAADTGGEPGAIAVIGGGVAVAVGTPTPRVAFFDGLKIRSADVSHMWMLSGGRLDAIAVEVARVGQPKTILVGLNGTWERPALAAMRERVVALGTDATKVPEATVAEPAVNGDVLPAPEPATAPAPAIGYCPNCGSTIDLGVDTFCSTCGRPTRFEGAPAAPQPESSSSAAAGSATFGVTSPWLERPSRVGGRTAPTAVWLLVLLLALGALGYGFTAVVLLWPGVQLSFSGGGLAALLGIALVIGGLLVGFVAALFGWLAVAVLGRQPTAPWLAAILGGLMSLSVVATLLSSSYGSQTWVVAVILVDSVGIAALAIGVGAVRAHMDPLPSNAAPMPTLLAATVTKWVAVMFLGNGVVGLLSLAAASSMVGTTGWMWLLSLGFLIASAIAWWASGGVLRGEGAARIASVIATLAFAALPFVAPGTDITIISWALVALAAGAAVLLFLPTSSEYFSSVSTSPPARTNIPSNPRRRP